MGPGKWLQRALKQRRHCHSLSPTQLDSLAQFNMTKTQAIFPNSGCFTGPCATLNRVSLRVLACLFDCQRLVTWIQTHPPCSPFYVSHANMCPISAFPTAWNIQHIHERSSIPDNPPTSHQAMLRLISVSILFFFPPTKKHEFQPDFFVPLLFKADVFSAATGDWSPDITAKKLTAQNTLLSWWSCAKIIKSHSKKLFFYFCYHKCWYYLLHCHISGVFILFS